MPGKIKAVLQRYWEIIIYLAFGILVTAANFAVYLPLHNLLGLSATVSNCAAWVAAVVVAFLTNKPFVFKSHDWSLKTVIREFSRFVMFRIGSGIAETAVLLLTVDILTWNGNLMKLLTSIAVVVANYVGSKLLVFKAKNEK